MQKRNTRKATILKREAPKHSLIHQWQVTMVVNLFSIIIKFPDSIPYLPPRIICFPSVLQWQQWCKEFWNYSKWCRFINLSNVGCGTVDSHCSTSVAPYWSPSFYRDAPWCPCSVTAIRTTHCSLKCLLFLNTASGPCLQHKQFDHISFCEPFFNIWIWVLIILARNTITNVKAFDPLSCWHILTEDTASDTHQKLMHSPRK